MKNLKFFIAIVLVSWACLLHAQDNAQVTVLFSPNGGCENTVCQAIDAAENEVLVAAYSFSSDPIARALYRATQRGIYVAIIFDKRQPNAHYSMVDELSSGGIECRIDDRHATMHQKTIIIDRKLLIAGSYNWTTNAEKRNSEILLLISSSEIAQKAFANWVIQFQQSKPAAVPYCNGPTCKKYPSLPPPNLPNRSHRRTKRW